MKNIEEKLWDYIDGSCTAEEQQAIDLLIQTDKQYKNKYNELLQINNELASMELDEPPMAFTYNVLENIRAEQAQKTLKATINSYVIKGIATFFVLIIGGLLITFFANADWSDSNQSVTALKLPDFTSLLNNTVLNIFLFLDTVLCLLFLDTYLRKRRIAKHI